MAAAVFAAGCVHPAPPSETRTDALSRRLPPELHVDGNRFKSASGAVVWLQGLSIDSLQWSSEGENILESIPVAIERWNANVVRLPVTETFWLGRERGQEDGGAAYRIRVDRAIDAAAWRGAYVILDLHRFRAPAAVHVEFWKDAAARYRNHPAVLFELFNEPHGVSWEVWRNGGPDSTGDRRVVGLQTLLDTVRSSGARNVVLVGGLDWAYDLTGILRGSALEDRAGNGVAYTAHLYPWKRDWQGKVLLAARTVPVMLTEVGCQREPMPWQRTTEDPATWAPDVLGLIQRDRLSWTAFSFHPRCAPRIISDWRFTPTPDWGAAVKDALAGRSFGLSRLR